jgi:NADH-quinone oxidoreductase subunit K
VTGISMTSGLVLSGVLFGLGLVGLMARRNILFILMSVEIMLNAAGLAFIVAAARWGKVDGQVMFIFVLAAAAAEVAVGLALILHLWRLFKTLNSDDAGEMKG